MMVDIKDFYLNTLMTRPEYMQLKIPDIPDKIIKQYNLRELVDNNRYAYCKISKGICGLPQAGIIAQELLAKLLAKHGYHKLKTIPGFWTHKTRPTTFTLVVDDFAIKIMSEDYANHLINILKKDHTITVDREVTKYIGLTIEWDYDNGKVQHIHMPGYLDRAMTRFKHKISTKVQNSPHRHIKVKYGAKKQYIDKEVEPPPFKRGHKIRPSSIRYTPILWESSQPHHSSAPGPQFHCHRASKTDGENNGDSETTVRLLCDAGGSHHNVHSQQNDPMHPQQRGLCQREERQKPSRRPFSPLKQQSTPPQ